MTDLSTGQKVSMLLSEVLDFDYEVIERPFAHNANDVLELRLSVPATDAIVAKWYMACAITDIATSYNRNKPCWDCAFSRKAESCTHGYSVPPRELLY